MNNKTKTLLFDYLQTGLGAIILGLIISVAIYAPNGVLSFKTSYPLYAFVIYFSLIVTAALGFFLTIAPVCRRIIIYLKERKKLSSDSLTQTEEK